MEPLRVCRVCLCMDVKMYDRHSFPLDTYLEPIVGVGLLTSVQLPRCVCFECAALLQKSYALREKCLLSQTLLYQILQTSGQITREEILLLNRVDLSLASNLKPQVIPEESTINIVHAEPTEPKEEPDTMGYIDVFKEEFDDDDNFPLGSLSSDDDEPLSVRKTYKEKKYKESKITKRGRKKKETAIHNTIQEVKNDYDTDLKLEDLLTSTCEDPPPAAPVPEKRKRGRPRKTRTEDTNTVRGSEKKPRRTANTGGVCDDNIDLEEYVTVIKLSEEDQLEEIRKRQFSSNYQNAAYQCNLCYKGFVDSRAWKHHVGKHDPSAGDVECPVCKFRFKTKRSLQKHAANHEKKYACKSCSYVSKTTTQAKQHQRWHKGVTYKCQYCDEVSTKWTSYLSHVRIKHPSEFICGACGYSFVSRLGLAMHRTMMHKELETTEGEEAGPYCAECDVKFVSLEAYKRHMVTSAKHTHADNFNRGCRVCGETFPSPEELRVHHRKEHARKRPKNYGKRPRADAWPARCDHCPEMIPNAREYWTHFRRAHPDQSYPIQKNHVCDICGKQFRGNAFLVYHKRTHTDERAYKCPHCPKAFHNRTNLHMHQRTHSERRPHACLVCHKAFKCKAALDRHFRSHTGEKPYECEVCGKAFGQSNSRKLHLRTVHLKQPAPYVSRARADRRPPVAPTAPTAPTVALIAPPLATGADEAQMVLPHFYIK